METEDVSEQDEPGTESKAGFTDETGEERKVSAEAAQELAIPTGLSSPPPCLQGH